MSKKFVIETVQVFVHKYYCEVDDPTWAMDAIVMEELEPYCTTTMSEDITGCVEVDVFPSALKDHVTREPSINAATYKYIYEEERWQQIPMWGIDL